MFPISAICEREEDIRKWARVNVRAKTVFTLLESDGNGLLLGTDGKRKVSGRKSEKKISHVGRTRV